MTTERELEAELGRSWRLNASSWSTVVRAQAIASRRLATDAAIEATIRRQAPARVLDLGCGEGWLTRTLANSGVAVTGVDGSAPLVEAARNAGRGIFHHLDYDDIVANPLQAGSGYDIIVANFSLLHETIGPLLDALRRCLAPSGSLVTQTIHPVAITPYRDGWRSEDFHSLTDIATFVPMPWFFRTLGSWIALLSAAGYRLTLLEEPVHPETGAPLSLLLTARPQ